MTSPHPNTALVVETNYLIAPAIEAPLVAHGYWVLIANDPAEAFDLLSANSIQIGVIDFRLQHEEPGGLVSVLTSLGVPYIFCTAASATEVTEIFPAAHVLAKPFSDETLRATLTHVERATLLVGA